MIKITKTLNKEYGCIDIEIKNNEGQKILISDWRNYHEANPCIQVIDLFTIHINNGHGLYGSEYLNFESDVIKKVARCIWIDSKTIEKLKVVLDSISEKNPVMTLCLDI